MSDTISFKKQKLNDKAVEIKRPGPVQGKVKYVHSKDMPGAEETSVLIWTTDSGELFVGGGPGNSIKKISDIVIVPDIDVLPEIGVKDKLYVSASDAAIYFWTKDGYQQIGTGNGSGGTIQTKIFEYPAAAQFPPAGQAKAIYIAKDADFLYRFDETNEKYIQLARQSTDPAIAVKFDAINTALSNKVDKTAMSEYRAKANKIAEIDLDPAIVSKLNATASGYDDTTIKSRVSAVENSKTDKSYAEATYLKKTDKITETQLDNALQNKMITMQNNIANKADQSTVTGLQTNVADLTNNVSNLQTAVNSKADASTVANLQTNVDNLQTDVVGIGNHISNMQTDLTNVESALDQKANASDLASYRPIDEKITADDLDPAVTNQVGKVPAMEQQIADLLARVAALENVTTSKDVLSLVAVTSLSVANGTTFGNLLLPNKVTANLSDSTTTTLSVTWNSATYDGNTAGTYIIDGVLILPTDVTNSKSLQPSVQVTVQSQAGSGYEYEFSIIDPMNWSKTLDEIHPGLEIKDEEFYGPSLDTGDGGTVKVYYLGTEPTRQYSSDPKYVPNDLQHMTNGSLTSPTPDQFVSYDSSIRTISFGSGSLGTRVYKLVKTA